MRPEDVNPENFRVERIVYNQHSFSIAFGVWTEDGTRRFAMRWNDSPGEKGYPNVFAHPMWFQLTEDVKGVVMALVENSDVSL